MTDKYRVKGFTVQSDHELEQMVNHYCEKGWQLKTLVFVRVTSYGYVYTAVYEKEETENDA